MLPVNGQNPFTTPSTERVGMYVGAAVLVVTTVALAVLLATHHPLGTVGYCLLGSLEVLSFVAVAIALYRKYKAQSEEEVDPLDEVDPPSFQPPVQPLQPPPFESQNGESQKIKPLYKVIASALRSFIIRYHESERNPAPDLADIDKGVAIIASLIKQILQNNDQHFDIFLYGYISKELNIKNTNDLLRKDNDVFIQELPNLFSSDPILQQVLKVLTKEVDVNDPDLTQKITDLRNAAFVKVPDLPRALRWIASIRELGHIDKLVDEFERDDLIEYIESKRFAQKKLAEFFIYSEGTREYGSAFYKVIKHLLKDHVDRKEEWLNQFVQHFCHITANELLFGLEEVPNYIALNPGVKLMQETNGLLETLVQAPTREAAANQVGQFAANLTGKRRLQQIVSDRVPTVAGSAIAQTIYGIFQPGGVLDRVVIKNLFGFMLKHMRDRIGPRLDADVGRLPLNDDQKRALMHAHRLLVPHLLDPLYHAALDSEHPLHGQIRHIVSLFTSPDLA